MYESHITFTNDNLTADKIAAARKQLAEHNIKLLVFSNGYPAVSQHAMTSRACCTLTEVVSVAGIVEAIAKSLDLRIIRNKLEAKPTAADILAPGQYFEAHIDFVPKTAMDLARIASKCSVSRQLGKFRDGHPMWVATVRTCTPGCTYAQFLQDATAVSEFVAKHTSFIGKVHSEIAITDNNVELDYDWVK